MDYMSSVAGLLIRWVWLGGGCGLIHEVGIFCEFTILMYSYSFCRCGIAIS